MAAKADAGHASASTPKRIATAPRRATHPTLRAGSRIIGQSGEGGRRSRPAGSLRSPLARRPVERTFPPGREESQAFPVKILHVVPRIPFPADSGGTLRALQLLRALDAAFEVTVLAPDLPGGDARALRAELRGRVVTARETGGTAGWALSEVRSVLCGGPVGYARYAGRNLRAA